MDGLSIIFFFQNRGMFRTARVVSRIVFGYHRVKEAIQYKLDRTPVMTEAEMTDCYERFPKTMKLLDRGVINPKEAYRQYRMNCMDARLVRMKMVHPN